MTTTFLETQKVAADTIQIGGYLPVPNLGILAVNSYLVKARDPILIDTGLAAWGSDFLNRIEAELDWDDLKYLWLTHLDPDHIGNLRRVLEKAPQVTLVTSFLGTGKLALMQVEHPAIRTLRENDRLSLSDRELVALSPPCFDAPETLACFDDRSRTVFSADCFGALLSEPAENADRLEPAQLRDGLMTWAKVDAPWLSWVSESAMAVRCKQIQALQAERLLSSHLPPARFCRNNLYRYLLAVCAPSGAG